MEIWFASTNPGKLREFREIVGDKHKVMSLQDLKSYSQPPETGKTFEENARLKARSVKALKPETWVVAEDSGLEVEGLDNMPGVHSARYAGPKARDVENTSKVLKMMFMRSSLNRKAKFTCFMIAYDPQGNEHKFEGTMVGEIAKDMRGKNGFGYDSIFIPEGQTLTWAEMEPIHKVKMSHRRKATDQLLALLSSYQP